MPSYRPAFDGMQQLRELACPILAMSATLTASQIDVLKQKYVRSDQCLVITKGVQWENLRLSLQLYRRRKLISVEYLLDDDDQSDKDSLPDRSLKSSTSLWADSITKTESQFEDNSTILYLDFAKDLEEITEWIVCVGSYRILWAWGRQPPY